MSFSFEQFFVKSPEGEGELSFLGGKYLLGVRASFTAKWDEMKKRMLLEESQEFSNGETQSRVWRFNKNGIYRWQGFCPGEVIGDVPCEVVDNRLTFKCQFMFPIYKLIRVPVNCNGVVEGVSENELTIDITFDLFRIPFAMYRLTLNPTV